MSTTYPSTGDGSRKNEQIARAALIREQILSRVGTPLDLLTVQVRELWAGHFRVNVVAGASANVARVAASYYVLTDDEHRVISTTPTLKRLDNVTATATAQP